MTEAPGPSRKGPAAFRTISEASAELGVAQHVLRFWETKFAFIRPMKRAGGRRFYRPQDLDVLRGVRALLQEEGYTIKGVQKLHKEQGLRRLVAASGIGEAEAGRLAAAMEAEAASQEVEDLRVEDPEVAPPNAEASAPGEIVTPPPPTAEPVLEDADWRPRGDLFDDVEPRAALAEPPPSPEARSRPILDAAARRRLMEVLSDLETTKAGIDALLQES